MEARLTMMEQLVGKPNTEMETLKKENEILKVATSRSKNVARPSNREHVESKDVGGR